MCDGRCSVFCCTYFFFFFFQAEDGIRDYKVTGVQTCALPIYIGVTRSGSGMSPAGGCATVSACIWPGDCFNVCVPQPPMNISRQAASVSPTLIFSFTSFVIDIYINSPSGLYSTTASAQSPRLVRNASHGAICVFDATGSPLVILATTARSLALQSRECNLARMCDS